VSGRISLRRSTSTAIGEVSIADEGTARRFESARSARARPRNATASSDDGSSRFRISTTRSPSPTARIPRRAGSRRLAARRSLAGTAPRPIDRLASSNAEPRVPSSSSPLSPALSLPRCDRNRPPPTRPPSLPPDSPVSNKRNRIESKEEARFQAHRAHDKYGTSSVCCPLSRPDAATLPLACARLPCSPSPWAAAAAAHRPTTPPRPPPGATPAGSSRRRCRRQAACSAASSARSPIFRPRR
jgi:hypothetical protein